MNRAKILLGIVAISFASISVSYISPRFHCEELDNAEYGVTE